MSRVVLKDYAPSKVSVNWGGIPFKGFAEDTFIQCARATENTNSSTGADGSVGITVSADKTGTIEVTLMQNSPTNRILSAIQADQDLNDTLLRANFTIADPSGGTLVKAFAAHIQSPPDVTLGAEQNEKTWTFFVERMIYVDASPGFIQSAAEISEIDDAVSGLRAISERLTQE